MHEALKLRLNLVSSCREVAYGVKNFLPFLAIMVWKQGSPLLPQGLEPGVVWELWKNFLVPLGHNGIYNLGLHFRDVPCTLLAVLLSHYNAPPQHDNLCLRFVLLVAVSLSSQEESCSTGVALI